MFYPYKVTLSLIMFFPLGLFLLNINKAILAFFIYIYRERVCLANIFLIVLLSTFMYLSFSQIIKSIYIYLFIVGSLPYFIVYFVLSIRCSFFSPFLSYFRFITFFSFTLFSSASFKVINSVPICLFACLGVTLEIITCIFKLLKFTYQR